MNSAPASSVAQTNTVDAMSGETAETKLSAVAPTRASQPANQNCVCPRRCLCRIHAKISSSTDESAKLSPRISTQECPQRNYFRVFTFLSAAAQTETAVCSLQK